MRTLHARRIGSFVFAVMALWAGSASAESTLEKIKRTGTMVVGTSAAYAPFEYVADGKLVGFDIDLANEIARRMAVNVEWQEIEFKGIVAALKSKRVDILFTALTKTKEREEQIAFSDGYYDAGIGAAKPAGSAIAKPSDLNGKVVGVQIGTSGQAFVRENIPGITEMKSYDTILLALKDLANGRLEAVVNPLPSIRYNLRGLSGLEVTDVWRSSVVGVGMRKEDESLISDINRHLAALRQEHFLDHLEKKWF